MTSGILDAHFEESPSIMGFIFSDVHFGGLRASREILEIVGRVRRADRIFEPYRD